MGQRRRSSTDATGRRTAKTIDGTTTAFLYDGVDAVQTDVGGSVNVRLLGAAIDEWFASIGPGGVSVPLVDALGSTVQMRDGISAIGELSYEPYGRSASSGSVLAYPFSGRELDYTALYFYRARYVSTQSARFTSQDPLGLAAGPNGYLYVGGNPLRWTDPRGLQAEPVSTLMCMAEGGLEARDLGEQHGWRYAHCMGSCTIKKSCGAVASLAAQQGKEALDLIRCLGAGRADSCYSVYQASDFEDNNYGYSCPIKSNLQVVV